MAAAPRSCTTTAPCVALWEEEAAAVGGAASNRGADGPAWDGMKGRTPTRGEVAGSGMMLAFT